MAQPPFGSHLRSRAVQQALQGLAEAAQQAQQASVGSSPYKRPSGSAYGDPHVQQALQGLAEAAQQGAPDVRFKRPTGSSLGTADAQSALGGLGQIVKDEREHPQVQPAPGKTERRHPAKDGSLAERAAEFAGQIQMENKALYAAHNALNGGELSPEMLARWDQPRYKTGCEALLNMVPMPQGGITKRPGMVSMGAGGTGKARLFPFIFSAGESRVLELFSSGGGSTLKVWFPSGASYATQLELPYSAAEIRDVQMAQSSDVLYVVHPNHAPAKIMRYGDYDWRYAIVDWMPSIGAPTISNIWMEGEGSGSNTTYRYVATAIDAETGEESLPSSERSISGKALSQTYFTRVQLASSGNAAEYRIYKYRGGVFGYVGSIVTGVGVLAGVRMGAEQVGISSFSGQITRTVYNDEGYSNQYYGDSSDPVHTDVTSDLTVASGGGHAFLFSGGLAAVRVTKTTTTTVVTWQRVVSGSDEYSTPVMQSHTETSTTTERFWVIVQHSGSSPAGTYSSWLEGDLGGSSEYPSGTAGHYTLTPVFESGHTGSLIFEDKNIEPDTADTPPRARNPFDGGNYPSVVFFHQQRLGFASSRDNPLTVWLSQAGNFESMAASLPPADDDAIEATLAAVQANRILWCQSDRTSLAIGTEGGEWILTGTDGAAVTPSDLAFQPQTYNGSEAGLPVLRAGSGLVYMQRGGRVVREFGYSFQADRYESNDLSLLARHVLKGSPVVSWAWQGEPYGIIWCVLANGKLAGLTYMREHDVIGWHRHETAGTVEDVVAIPSSDGSTQVWMHVVRNGTRYVERLAPFFEGGGASGAVHVDGVSGATFSARCIPSLPETQVQNGTTFLKVRKINAVKARCIHSRGFKARVGTGAQYSVPARGSSYVEGHVDWAVPLASGWRENDRLELIFDGADPVTVLGIVTTVEIAEEGGGQK